MEEKPPKNLKSDRAIANNGTRANKVVYVNAVVHRNPLLSENPREMDLIEEYSLDVFNRILLILFKILDKVVRYKSADCHNFIIIR